MKRVSLQKLLYPAGFLLGMLAIWQLVDLIFDIKRIILPSPYEIATVSWSKASELLQATLVTGQAAFLGFAISICLGILLACYFRLHDLQNNVSIPT